MNGNFKTLIAIAATPLLLLSCSDEVKLTTEGEGENLVSLTVQLPEELGTRAFGEASKIKSRNMPCIHKENNSPWQCLTARLLKP